MNDGVQAALKAKLQGGPPVTFTPEEVAAFTETLRGAMATTLEREPAGIPDGARIFDELGLDSIDVFDLLDQLGEVYDVAVELEALPEGLLRGGEAMTFADFAALLIAHFREGPAAPHPAEERSPD